MRVHAGHLSEIPEDACVAAGDGWAVVVRDGDRVHAYRNRCVHQDSPIEGGIVRDGVLSCPLHFWRYHVRTGQLVGASRTLERYPVEVVDGEVFVEVPDAPPPMSLRQQLLARAHEWDREQAFDDMVRGDTTP